MDGDVLRCPAGDMPPDEHALGVQALEVDDDDRWQETGCGVREGPARIGGERDVGRVERPPFLRWPRSHPPADILGLIRTTPDDREALGVGGVWIGDVGVSARSRPASSSDGHTFANPSWHGQVGPWAERIGIVESAGDDRSGVQERIVHSGHDLPLANRGGAGDVAELHDV